jgi:hypothetical protein
MTREQALSKLKDRNLSDHEREQVHQYLFYLEVEGVEGKPLRPPARNHSQREASKARKSSPSRKNNTP